MHIQELATFAGGCFWCTEAIFQRLQGVLSVTPGYAGGKRENPTYEQVHSGATGHAEAIHVTFDPHIISYETLLEVFWMSHDPTTLNRDGANIGPEYRSAIFYHTEEQKRLALQSKDKLERSGKYPDPIVTEITPYTTFYPGKQEHKDFYQRNPSVPYCRIIIDPKIQKFMKEFAPLTIKPTAPALSQTSHPTDAKDS